MGDQADALELRPGRLSVSLARGELRLARHYCFQGVGEVAGSLPGVVGNVPDVVQ